MPRISTGSTDGGLASISSTLDIRDLAMLPARCACRSSSLAKASKTPNVVGESWSANQIGVVASRFVNSRPAARKSATACSLPCLASSRTNSPCVIIISSPFDGYEALQSAQNLRGEPLWAYWQDCHFCYHSRHSHTCSRLASGLESRTYKIEIRPWLLCW